jgi:excinuclease ABC subunit A
LLYASVGTPHCPNCGKPIARQTADQIVQRILAFGDGQRVVIMAPVVRGRKGEFRELLDQLEQQGFRARIDGESCWTGARITPLRRSSIGLF